MHADVALDENAILSVEDVGFMQATRFSGANAESGSCLPWPTAAANATRVSAGCLEAIMNLESGRSVGSTGVSPFIDPGEKIWDAFCSPSFDLVPAKLAILGLLRFSPSRVVFTISSG